MQEAPQAPADSVAVTSPEEPAPAPGQKPIVHTLRLLWSLETEGETISDPSIWNFLRQLETYVKGKSKVLPDVFVGGKFVCRENAVVTTNGSEIRIDYMYCAAVELNPMLTVPKTEYCKDF